MATEGEGDFLPRLFHLFVVPKNERSRKKEFTTCLLNIRATLRWCLVSVSVLARSDAEESRASGSWEASSYPKSDHCKCLLLPSRRAGQHRPFLPGGDLEGRDCAV